MLGDHSINFNATARLLTVSWKVSQMPCHVYRTICRSSHGLFSMSAKAIQSRESDNLDLSRSVAWQEQDRYVNQFQTVIALDDGGVLVGVL
jgi:hypothetical protein